MSFAGGTSTVKKFIPEVWSGRLISNLNKRMVYGNMINRDYEGEISGQGDTVHINSIGRISVIPYTRDTDLAAAEKLVDGRVSLVITEANAFNFAVDDIDKAQVKGALMEEAMKEAGYALANVVDQHIAGLYTTATAGAGLASARTTNKGLIYDLFVGNRQKFQEMDVPIDELSAVIPPWMESLLLLDPRFISATSQGDNVLRTGEIGNLAGFTLYVSNNVPVTTSTTNNIMSFSGKKAITMADQINKTEAYRPEGGFRDAVKGLHVYGAKTVRPQFCITNAVVNA